MHSSRFLLIRITEIFQMSQWKPLSTHEVSESVFRYTPTPPPRYGIPASPLIPIELWRIESPDACGTKPLTPTEMTPTSPPTTPNRKVSFPPPVKVAYPTPP